MKLIVDGEEVKDLSQRFWWRIAMYCIITQNNAVTATPGTTKAISDGFWVLFEPLPSGSHDIN